MITKKEAMALIDSGQAKFIEEYHVQDDLFEQIYEYEEFKIVLPVHGNERYSVPELIEIE